MFFEAKKQKTSLATSIKYISVDFELGFHHAIKKVFLEWELVGCMFHLKKAILTKCSKKWSHLANEQVWPSLSENISKLHEAQTEQEFKDNIIAFQHGYREESEFISYMMKTWLLDNARFPPRIWAQYCYNQEVRNKIKWTNNESESFGKHLSI